MKEGGATVMNVSGAAAVAKQSSAPRKSSALQKQVPNATAQKMARIKNDQYIWTMNDLVHELRYIEQCRESMFVELIP